MAHSCKDCGRQVDLEAMGFTPAIALLRRLFGSGWLRPEDVSCEPCYEYNKQAKEHRDRKHFDRQLELARAAATESKGKKGPMSW